MPIATRDTTSLIKRSNVKSYFSRNKIYIKSKIRNTIIIKVAKTEEEK